MITATGARTPGRPGVFLAPARQQADLRPVRLDITGFVGVALRGPVDTPVRVERWSDFVDTFGGFEAPPGGPTRLLPYAVSAFFRQGGRTAYVLRVAPHSPEAGSGDDATARFLLTPDAGRPAGLSAADEGEWGNDLAVSLVYRASQRVLAEVLDDGSLMLPAGADAPVGSVLRLSVPADPAGTRIRRVQAVDGRAPRGTARAVTLDTAPPFGSGVLLRVEVVTATLTVRQPRSPGRADEVIDGLGLHPGHPRWIRDVLADPSMSGLVSPRGDWTDVDLTPEASLSPLIATLEHRGADRAHLIDATAFFDDGPADLHAIDEEVAPGQPAPHVGVDRMARVTEIGLLCVPDLTWGAYQPAPQAPARHPHAPLPCRCRSCEPPAPEPGWRAPDPPRGRLDARDPDSMREITLRQHRIVEVARQAERFVALLDVPDGLAVEQIAAWRATFDSSYAAAYHPWLAVAAEGGGETVTMAPSCFAAGIIAARENRLGLPWGPANELADGAVQARSAVTDALHESLHGMGVNVYRRERDGFRLSAARTLSTDPDYRQLSVRRLMTMLRLTLQRECADLAFEPNTPELRERLRQLVTHLLRGLARQGAFAGRSEAESFFVHCGDDVNPPSSQALGRLIAEIGVAPAAPLEFILVRIARDPDGALGVESDGV
ncbi:phage tail sheath family protein [Demequina mangrovi]|uniref:Tail sheath protein C-terminal domain-containing protein n=1 Tax=Demequina mangrovi TaxID=1043493 RepID=A0A1H6TUH7_9MICO|nr:phage tail sheath subtilisin-like domain-containing protein [Demequina mangrovi]SEI82906.1 hypothetical protein SAMN05421637_0123 [Demequina mangrovi]